MSTREAALSFSDQGDTHAGGFFGAHRRGEVNHGVVALVSTIALQELSQGPVSNHAE